MYRRRLAVEDKNNRRELIYLFRIQWRTEFTVTDGTDKCVPYRVSAPKFVGNAFIRSAYSGERSSPLRTERINAFPTELVHSNRRERIYSFRIQWRTEFAVTDGTDKSVPYGINHLLHQQHFFYFCTGTRFKLVKINTGSNIIQSIVIAIPDDRMFAGFFFFVN